MDRSSHSIRWYHRLAGFIGWFFLSLVARTSHVLRSDYPAALRYRRRGLPAIYAFWHNTQAFLSYAHRGQKIAVMVSRSADGEYIAQVMSHLDLPAVRGSTSKGGVSALLELIERGRAGEKIGITPDGPRGPAEQVSGGVVKAAQSTGLPVIPTGLSATRKAVFNSWDRFFVPVPFSDITVSHGRPVFVSPDLPLEAAKAKIAAALDGVTEEGALMERGTDGVVRAALGSILFFVYNFLLLLAMPLLVPVLAGRYGMKLVFENLSERLAAHPPELPNDGAERLWFHAASVGEWQALKPLIAPLKNLASVRLIVTVTTTAAKKIVRRDEPDLAVSLAPIDLPWVVRSWIRKIRPDALCLVETELWPNMINGCYNADIPVMIVNGRLSPKSTAVWKIVRPLSSRIMKQISAFFVRSEKDGRHFCEVGAPPIRVSVVGNTKSDTLNVAVSDRRQTRRDLFSEDEGIYIIGGSTWHGEEEHLLRIFSQPNTQRVRLILAPRKVARLPEVERLLGTLPQSWSKWSRVKADGHWTSDILLVDTLGDLNLMYRTADIAFVGGTMSSHGGQNPLEPAAVGIPIVLGRSMENFEDEAAALKKAGAVREVRDGEDLMRELYDLIHNQSARDSLGRAALEAARARQGASRRTVDALKELLQLP